MVRIDHTRLMIRTDKINDVKYWGLFLLNILLLIFVVTHKLGSDLMIGCSDVLGYITFLNVFIPLAPTPQLSSPTFFFILQAHSQLSIFISERFYLSNAILCSTWILKTPRQTLSGAFVTLPNHLLRVPFLVILHLKSVSVSLKIMTWKLTTKKALK